MNCLYCDLGLQKCRSSFVDICLFIKYKSKVCLFVYLAELQIYVYIYLYVYAYEVYICLYIYIRLCIWPVVFLQSLEDVSEENFERYKLEKALVHLLVSYLVFSADLLEEKTVSIEDTGKCQRKVPPYSVISCV